MCRHLAWLGEPRSVASLVLDPPHGLLAQSYAPRRQSHGLMNADGWGVGLLGVEVPDAPDGPGGLSSPVRWRSSRPLWADPSFHSVAPVLRAPTVVAAVRSATPGMPADETAAAPFTDGRWLVSHNGRVERSVLPAAAAAAAESTCDSAVLAAHLLPLLRAGGVEALVEGVRAVAADDAGARLSLVLSDGEQVLALSWGDALSHLLTDTGLVVASEPYDDDPRWVDVADRHLLVADRGTAPVVTAL